MTALVIITTRDRPLEANRLIEQLTVAAKRSGVDLHFLIYDDASHKAVVCGGATIRRSDRPHGRERYWQVVSQCFRDAKMLHAKHAFDFVYMIPDDGQVKRDFFRRSAETFGAIDDEKKATLNLIYQKRSTLAQWGSIKPRLRFYGKEKVLFSQWVDCCFMCRPQALDLLRWQIKPIRREWSRDPMLGSGVGAQMSRRLRKAGAHMFGATERLVYRESCRSVMFPHKIRPADEHN